MLSLPTVAETSASRPPHVRHAGVGRGWIVVGPGVIAGVPQAVRLAGPYTSREAAEIRAAFERGRSDVRALGILRTERKAARILAAEAGSRELRAYWLGVCWEGSRHEFPAGRIGGPGWSVKA